jgi:hypothetical protein
LAIEIDISLPAARVVRTLEQLEVIHGLPKAIRLNNGSELRSAVFMGWCEEKELHSNLSSSVNNNKMPLLSGLTAPTVMEYSMPIYLKTSGRSVTLQKTGSRFTTKKGQTGH